MTPFSADRHLPRPLPGFAWRIRPWGPALQCTALAPLAGHLFTTCALTLQKDDGPAASGWGALAEALDVPASALVRLRQVHGTDVVVRRRGGRPDASGLPAADIVVSDDPDVVLAVQTADCVPLLVADRRTGAVAAAHAGWRGTAAGAARVTVEALQRAFGARPPDLVAAIGPSIGPCCYEVGGEVRDAFVRAGHAPGDVERWFVPPAAGPSGPGGRRHLDLWAANRDQLVAAGLDPAAVHTSGLCTADHPAVLCSYRRDGAGAGRLAGAIRMTAGL